jgi:hypothetical protein
VLSVPPLAGWDSVIGGESWREAADGSGVATVNEPAVPPTTRATAAGGAALWFGMLVFGGSTVALLAVLSRHPHRTTFSALAALLSAAFVVSLIPSGVSLRSASLVADGRPLPQIRVGQATLLGAASLALAPLFAFLLHVPVAAMAFVSLQMVVFIPLAIKQGAYLALHRYRALGLNFVLEGGARFAIGAVAGLTLGVTGLAAGLCVGTAVALLALPYPHSDVSLQDRPRTSIIDTSLSLALLGLYVQLDVLIAPSVVARGDVTAYDLAAVPSKGVYLMLLAAGPFVFPFVRRLGGGGKRFVVTTASAALAVGLVFAGVLVAARPLIALILGRPEAGLVELSLLGAAMAIAGVTGVVVNSSVARGVNRPWPPLVLGIATLLFCWPFRPNAMDFAIVVLVSQGITCVLSLAICLWGRQHEPVGEAGPEGLREIEAFAEAGDPLALAQAMYELPKAEHDVPGSQSSEEATHDAGRLPKRLRRTRSVG